MLPATSIAIPATNALDNDPVVSDSKEDANPTGLITHNDVDERLHGETSILSNELHTDMRRPQWNSLKSKILKECLSSSGAAAS